MQSKSKQLGNKFIKKEIVYQAKFYSRLIYRYILVNMAVEFFPVCSSES